MCFFCVAYVVASNDNDLQVVNWPVLMLAGAAVGFAASPIWVAQGAYITQQAKLWSAASPPLDAAGNAIVGAADAIPRMGDANGIFWACFQATQISGNILPAVMQNAGASNTAVFLVYLVFAICGTLVASRCKAFCCRMVANAAARSGAVDWRKLASCDSLRVSGALDADPPRLSHVSCSSCSIVGRCEPTIREEHRRSRIGEDRR